MCSLNGNKRLNFMDSLEFILIATSGLGKGRLSPITHPVMSINAFNFVGGFFRTHAVILWFDCCC